MTQNRLASALALMGSFILFLSQTPIAIEIRAIITVILAVVVTVLFYFYKIRANNQSTTISKARLNVLYLFVGISFLIGLYSLLIL
ncbi:hypothetical protein [Flavobacterium sp.]|uniref:hypothetical protein n=1 Tax=Flavobacterium sp. TaxID=239 RepID=UPI003B9BD9F7